MKLADWMEREGITRSELARRLGVKPSYITMILNGKRTFHPTKGLKIVEMTKGKVGYADLYGKPKK